MPEDARAAAAAEMARVVAPGGTVVLTGNACNVCNSWENVTCVKKVAYVASVVYVAHVTHVTTAVSSPQIRCRRATARCSTADLATSRSSMSPTTRTTLRCVPQDSSLQRPQECAHPRIRWSRVGDPFASPACSQTYLPGLFTAGGLTCERKLFASSTKCLSFRKPPVADEGATSA